MFTGGRQLPGDHNDRGVEQAHRISHRGTEHAPGVAHQPGGQRIPVVHSGHDVVHGLHRASGSCEIAHDRPAAGIGFHATQLPAAAQRRLAIARNVGPDMAEVAGGALGPAQRAAGGDDARADAGSHLDQQQVVDLRITRGSLAHDHRVHVVVDEHEGSEMPQSLGDVRAVPTGHDRRADDGPVGELDGSWHRSAHPPQRKIRVAQLGQTGGNSLEHHIRAVGDADRLVVTLQHGARQVGARQPHAGGADVGQQQVRALRVEDQGIKEASHD